MAASIRNSPQTASCFTRAGPAWRGGWESTGWFQDEDKARRKLRMSPAEHMMPYFTSMMRNIYKILQSHEGESTKGQIVLTDLSV